MTELRYDERIFSIRLSVVPTPSFTFSVPLSQTKSSTSFAMQPLSPDRCSALPVETSRISCPSKNDCVISTRQEYPSSIDIRSCYCISVVRAELICVMSVMMKNSLSRCGIRTIPRSLSETLFPASSR